MGGRPGISSERIDSIPLLPSRVRRDCLFPQAPVKAEEARPVVGLEAPEPTVSEVLGAVAERGASSACGGFTYPAWQVEGLKQQSKIDEIIAASSKAIVEFQDLQRDPP